jgi:ATP-dependent DNA ligase
MDRSTKRWCVYSALHPISRTRTAANRKEFVVVGWSDPVGTRHRIGALLLGYYAPDGKLIYAGRAGTGMPVAKLD